MPGATLELLAHAVNINYEHATTACDRLTLALTLGNKATIRTSFDDGASRRFYDLELSLGGLSRLPITSIGIIPAGTWGNLPGGETFIVPIEGSATGSFVLNGSFSGRVLRRHEALVLTFSHGELLQVEGVDGPAKSEFVNLVQHMKSIAGPGALQIAQFGMGLNPAISILTGNPLFDEKCAGTVHVGIGDNYDYGGSVTSPVHQTFVSRDVSVEVDDRRIISDGTLVVQDNDWDSCLMVNGATSITPSTKLRRTLTGVQREADGGLRINRRVGTQRLCTYRLGFGCTSSLFWEIYSRTPAFPIQFTVEDLLSLDRCDHDLRLLIATLIQHDVLEVL
jgi:hypothetical protein